MDIKLVIICLKSVLIKLCLNYDLGCVESIKYVVFFKCIKLGFDFIKYLLFKFWYLYE